MSPRLALGVAEEAVVENQHHEARPLELRREVREVVLLDRAKAVGHDDGRALLAVLQAIRQVQPACAVQTLAREVTSCLMLPPQPFLAVSFKKGAIPDSENPRPLGERPLVLPTPTIVFAREHELSSEPAPGAQGGYRSLFTLDPRPSRLKTEFDMLLCLGIITLVAGQSKLWGVRK
jgi:hypothetical protein